MTLSTIAAEKFGGRVGGVISGIPSTVVISYFFIGWTHGLQHAYEATTVYPAAFAFNVVSLVVYAYLAKTKMMSGIIGLICTWFISQSLLVFMNLSRFSISIVLWLLLSTVSYLFLCKQFSNQNTQKTEVTYRFVYIIYRAIFGGAVVALSILISKIGGPIYGGIFAAFPAVFLATLLITSITVNVAFSRSLVKPMMISGTINCVTFVIIFRYAITAIPLSGAIALAYGISLVCAIIVYLLLDADLI